ncbi:MAG: DUF3999 family protein [Dehalococcoidia bacterium]
MKNKSLLIARSIAAAALMLALVSSSAAADFSLRDWRYLKSVTLPSGLGEKGLVELLPDPEVFAGSAPGLVDLRIIDSEDTEVPYKLEVGRSERHQTPFSVALLDKGYVPGLHTIFTADLGRSGVLHNEIAFDTPSANFRRTAVVETSNDGATWAKIAEQEVYDFTVKERDFTTRDTHMRYPDSTTRYLRVAIADEGEGPLEVTGATVFFIKETPAREVLWPSAIVGTSQDTDRRATLVEVDLGTTGIPSYRMAVKVSDVNFYRQVTLETSNDGKEWEWRAPKLRAQVYAYDTPKFVGKDLAFTYPETTSRYLRLIIHDEDSPPLKIQGVDVWGLQHRLVFTADSEHSYTLYYGNLEARRPSYDIERVFPYLATEELPRAQLGPQVSSTQFVEKLPPVSERFPWLLPSILAVVAVLASLLLLGVIRQARRVLPPPSEGS